MDPYSTHLHALVDTAMTTKGPILELGCGDYSTPILRSIAKAQERGFKCQASNKEWASKYDDVEIISWDSWEPPTGPWGMVFLDSEEHTFNRYKRLRQLANVTDTIVLHDANVPHMIEMEGWKVAYYDTNKPITAVLRKNEANG